MDPEARQRRQSIKVIISEAIMVLAVIVTVIILALIVSGYWVNSDFKVERQGMLQIASIPTGADVEIDNTTAWLQRTNTSKVLSSGEHTVKLTREGYDSWSKTININEGLLYRIHYPRLFLLNRSSEKVFDSTGTTFATIAPSHNSLLLINETTEWQLLNLEAETIEAKKLDIAEYFNNVSVAEDAKVGLFTGKIKTVNWDRDAARVLFHVEGDNGSEWVLFDSKNPSNSINLTKQFGVDFELVKIFDNSASNLLVVQNGNLHKLDVSGRAISTILVENIGDFGYYGNELVFSARDAEGYYVGTGKVGDNKINILERTAELADVATFRFYDNRYIAVMIQNQLTLHKKDNYDEIVANFELNFAPETLRVGHDGEFITMSTGNQIITLDMEARKLLNWQPVGEKFDWLDNDMIYSVSDGELGVYDFDGLNHRVLAKNVSRHFPVTITNDKWLYYFSDDSLVREWLIPR